MALNPFWTAWLPALACLAACLAAAGTRSSPWPLARTGTSVALVLALAHAGLALAGHQGAQFGAQEIFGLLVAFLGWIIVHFSARYLAGEARERRYVIGLLGTLAAVAGIAATNHLGVMLALWIGTSIGLHALLTFYPDRPAALQAAHKKFVASRLAEACFAVALVLIQRETGTLHLDALSAYAAARESLPLGMHVAMTLIALAAVIKCAQVPVHGWLIQVMEAPTPVSALLHAGIVNVSGFVLIRLAELVSLAPGAQTVLVVTGGVTALLAGLVMLTRVSIKVRLAWSTCAQMGFMLVECGLGLYELALLHLVAHSLYKAHAFLTAGETVARVRQRDAWPGQDATTLLARNVWMAGLAALALKAGTVVLWTELGASDVPWIAIVVVATGLAPLLWHAPLAGAARIVGLTLLYMVWHQAFGTLLQQGAPPHFALELFAAACFVSVYFLQFWLVHRASSPLARALYPWAYAGFYADERFTRWALGVFPRAMTRNTPAASTPLRIEETP